MLLRKLSYTQYYWTMVSEMRQLTTSNLITSISAVSSPITAIRRADTLKIVAPKASTWAWDWNSEFMSQVKEPEAASIPKYIDLKTLQTYGSSSRHFHQSMFWSQYIVQWWKYTGHWYTETGWSYNLCMCAEGGVYLYARSYRSTCCIPNETSCVWM